MKKNKQLTLKITEADYTTLEALAEREERTLSDTARRLLKKSLNERN